MSGADPTAAGSRFQGVDVLLVEDETIVSFLIEDMLTELGCTSVRHASGVSEALAILDGHRPDVAILDVNLAGEMGYAVAERLDAGNIPFIFATGYGGRGVPNRWSQRPVLQKPFRVEAIAGALFSALGR